MSHSIIKIQAPGRKAEKMGSSMALAFTPEPNMVYALPDQEKREQSLKWLFGSLVPRLGFQYGEVYSTADTSGGAVWLRPGARVTLWGSLKAGGLATPFHFGLRGMWRWTMLGDRVEMIRNNYAPPSHWYLLAIGVDPSKQDRGIGSAMLQPVLTKADKADDPCYLETFSEQTVKFYQRLGFRVIHTDAVPNGGPPFWSMIYGSVT